MNGPFGLFYFIFSIILYSCFFVSTEAYDRKDHPCCQEPGENFTLAMVLDPFEIYGHDPADKLDHLAHYQTEMMKIKLEVDQYVINERVHVATDHLERFVHLHTKELKILKIALDDATDNMLTMYDIHNAIKMERIGGEEIGAVPMEFYVSEEYFCGGNVYLFVSELYSDLYNMGRSRAPYCVGQTIYFLGFAHDVDDPKYHIEDDPDIAFPMDDYQQGLECHNGVCIFRFPPKKNTEHSRDVVTLPKAHVKCGLTAYQLPPLTEAYCMVTSGSFILDFNIQGLKYRHHDFLLTIPNGQTYYTKEPGSPLTCHHYDCEWTFSNFYGGPFTIPGEPATGHVAPIPPWVESAMHPDIPTTTPMPLPERLEEGKLNYAMDGCWYMFPPNYGSIAGVSYLDPLSLHDYRYTCQGNNKGLYWYPRGNNLMQLTPEQFYSPQEQSLM